MPAPARDHETAGKDTSQNAAAENAAAENAAAENAADVEPLFAFLREFAVARAELVVATPGGLAVLHSGFPSAYDHNTLLVWDEVDAADLVAAADDVLSDLRYRQIVVDGADLVADLADPLAAADYEREDDVLMVFTSSPDPDRRPGEVVELERTERIAVARAEWIAGNPSWDDDVVTQLAGRVTTAELAARCTFLGVRGPGGDVVAHADLFVRDDHAQIEEVMTQPEFQGQGYASRLILEALQQAPNRQRTFLVADAQDWPRRLYRRLGFVEVGHRGVFTRVAAAAVR